MLDALIYHPRRKHCKNPFGAVPLGTQVRFSAGLPAAAVGCTLCCNGGIFRHQNRNRFAVDAQGRAAAFTPLRQSRIWCGISCAFALLMGAPKITARRDLSRQAAPCLPFS